MRFSAAFPSILYDIAEENGYSIDSFSDLWGHRISNGERIMFIVGYQFPLNPASSKELCQDKALTCDVLTKAGIPAVEHYFYPRFPSKTEPSPFRDRDFAKKLIEAEGKAVLKDNYGTGGNQVYLIESMQDFDETLQKIHSFSYAAALSPFYEILNEYRFVMLDGEVQLVIRKDRQYTTDENGSRVYATWKHNLGQGAVGSVITDSLWIDALSKTVKDAVRALNMRFCSVDLAVTKAGVKVLEVNGGVMMEHFAKQSEENYQTAKAIYRKAIVRYLEQ
ncbi:MAG: ATP-grasp domain-containing protein [Lachnospiraceae bacterium]|nr:ATP-grasp domain-containing protein [Lachnospiraceae bacterium]